LALVYDFQIKHTHTHTHAHMLTNEDKDSGKLILLHDICCL